MTELVNNIADTILVSLILPNAIFAVRYYLYSPFGRTKEGINLLRQKLAISSLLIVIALSVILGPDYPFRPLIRLIAFSAVTFFFWTELVQLIGVQRQYRYRRFPRKKRSTT